MLAEVEKINALERPYDPAREPIPAEWTPEHVGRRLVEAFETLNKLPKPRGPKIPGNSWPSHVYEFADQRGWYDLSAAELHARDEEQNRSRQKPDSRQLAQMEKGLDWLRSLREVDDGLSRLLGLWAACRARNSSISEVCKARKWSIGTFYRQKDRACLWISAQLNTTRELVF